MSNLRTWSILAAAGLAVPASGAILQWDALFSGNASTANNWNPNQRPTAVDDLRFNSVLNNNYTVTYDTLVPRVRSHQYLGDNVTIRTVGGPHTITNTLSIENGSEILLDASTLHVGGSTTIGAVSGLGGRFTIDQSLFTGQQLTLGSTGPSDVIVTDAGRLEVPTVGLRGDSSLTLLNSAIAQLTTLTIGETVNANASSVLVSEGADMFLLGGITMSPVAGSSSLLRVVAGSNTSGTTIDAQGDLLIGANTTSAAAGTAAVTLGDMTSLLAFSTLVCDDLIVGDVNGGQGSLSLRSGVLRCASARFVGGHSSLTIEKGLLDCSGAFIWENGPLTIDGVDAAGILFRGVATLDVPLRFGVAREGHINVDGPSADVVINADVTLGEQSTGEGNIDVGNGGELEVAGEVRLGVSGTSSLAVDGGGFCFADRLVVAANSGSEAVIEVGASSAVGTFEALYLGGTSIGPGGTAAVRVANGVLSTQGTVVCWGGTTIELDGGSLVSSTTISMRAGSSLTLDFGTVRASGIHFAGALNPVGDGVDLTGWGEVNAAISGLGSNNDITATGPLSLGVPTSVTGYSGSSINLAVGPHTVTLGDADNADIGDTTIAGGTLVTLQSINIPPGKTVSGGGTIEARFIRSAGNINATTPQGFVIKGVVSGTGTLTGTLFDFSSTGGFGGRDTINAQIRGSAGSVISATGNLTLGTATSTGFSFDGRIVTNGNQVTLRDTSIAAVGDVELGGGSLFCTDTDLASDLNDVASGFGTIVTTPRTWINAGTVRPDGLGAPVIGQISTLGNVNMENVFDTAVIDLDIGGTSNATMDRFVVVGALTIDGTLRVRFVPGYVPAGGEVYTVITANSISGNFTSLDLPDRTRVIVNPTNVQVEALCTADQNADGNVDGDDVIDLFAAWDQGLIEADTNGDGSVDGDDVIIFFEHWDAGC